MKSDIFLKLMEEFLASENWEINGFYADMAACYMRTCNICTLSQYQSTLLRITLNYSNILGNTTTANKIINTITDENIRKEFTDIISFSNTYGFIYENIRKELL